jgi:Protein of unknown function (DUF2568)
METGIVLGLAYWGYATGSGVLAKVGLAIGAPLVGFGIWGVIDFHQAGRAAEGLRLVEELVISGLVALALWSVGQPVLGLMLAALSVLYHGLVYASGGRLLKPKPERADDSAATPLIPRSTAVGFARPSDDDGLDA